MEACKVTGSQKEFGIVFGEILQSEPFDLQFFASAEDEGRTEEPTSRRKSDARKEGQIPQTQELSTAMTMGVGYFTVWFLGGWMFFEIQQFTVEMLSMQKFADVNPGNIHRLLLEFIWICFKVVAPITMAALIASLAAAVSQVGIMFTTEPLGFDISKIKFSFKKIMEKLLFSKKMLWQLAMSLLKVVLIGVVAFEVIHSEFGELLVLSQLPLMNIIRFVLSMAFEIIFKAVFLLLLLSPIDYAFQYHQHQESLKMTPQQVKDERKQREGNPEVKKKQRQKMQEVSQRKMMEQVPEADVVITNPTHYAVALKYNEESMQAPTIVAKGEGMIAQRIKSIAAEFGVPVYEVPLLARTLYQLEIDQQIPPALYNAVAEVLAWVHQNRNDVSRREAARLEQEVKELDLATTG